MMLSVLVNKFNCPDCSAQAELSISAPLYICCASCGNTFFLDKEKNASKVELKKHNLQPIKTIALDATGVYKNTPFKIIGHIRSINNNAISNEWLMKFTNGKELWLIENGFSYFIFESEAIKVDSNEIKGKKIGSTLSINKTSYTIVDLSKQNEFQMKGQIPENCFNDDAYFKYEAIAANGNLASVCIFDKDIMEAYTGLPVNLIDLNLSTLVDFKNWM